MTLPTVEQIRNVQTSNESVPQLVGLMTPEEYSILRQQGYTFGSTTLADQKHALPGDRIIDTSMFAGGYGFDLEGPFGPVVAIYLRNPLDAPFGVYIGDSLYPCTVGPLSQRRLEFYTPTDSNGRVTSIWIEPVKIAEPTADGSVYVGLEP